MNYVFFFPDEMKASSVSCYGNRHVQMPNYDRLAEEGVRFDNCIVQNPVCSPSRCSLMTGRYIHNEGHRTLWHLLRPHEPSLFRYLKEAGYEIAWYGKNDLYSQEYLEEVCEDIDEKREGYRTPPTLRTGPVCGGENPGKPGDSGFYSFLYDPIPEVPGELTWDEPIARGIDFIRSRKPDSKPFFLYLPIGMPHPPYCALEQFYNLYDVEKVKADLIRPSETVGKPEFMELIRKYRKVDEISEEMLDKIYAVYLGMNTYVDTMLGGILEALSDAGLSQDTTVIVSSDHGDWAGNYDLVEKWPNAMDEDLVRVPLIIRTPGNAAGHVVKEPVALFDIMATVMDLSNIPPAHIYYAKSLVPQLFGAAGDPDRAIFCEGGYDTFELHCSEAYAGADPKGRGYAISRPENIYYPKVLQQKEHPESVCRTTMIRTMDYKLVLRTSGENELYHLTEDPGECRNLYGQSAYRKIQLELEHRMLLWYIRTADAVPMNDDPRGFAADS